MNASIINAAVIRICTSSGICIESEYVFRLRYLNREYRSPVYWEGIFSFRRLMMKISRSYASNFKIYFLAGYTARNITADERNIAAIIVAFAPISTAFESSE